jgi:hypothetical protein
MNITVSNPNNVKEEVQQSTTFSSSSMLLTTDSSNFSNFAHELQLHNS